MKKLSRILKSLFANSLYTLVGFTQRSPHKTICRSFRKKYPNAEFATWELLGHGIWEVTFSLDKREHRSIFGRSGEWMGTRTAIPKDILPMGIQEKVKNQIKESELLKAFRLNMPKGSYYELDFYDGTTFTNRVYDDVGNLREQRKP